MRKLITLLLGMLAVTGAYAGDINAAIGDGYKFLSLTPTGVGPGVEVDYLQANQSRFRDTPTAVGAGMMLSLPIPFLLRVDAGAKAFYLDSAGYGAAAMFGGRVTVFLSSQLEAFASAFYAPSRAATGTVKQVSDLQVGVRWMPFKLVGVEAGYRQFSIRRDDANSERKLSDGPYAGVSVKF